MARVGNISRETKETNIQLLVDLDGTGTAQLQTGIGFLDHMLELFCRHGLLDLTLEARGDLHVDAHHTVEDCGICLGQALKQALGDKRGIRRYGHCVLPMDESLVTAAVDLSGRAYCHVAVPFPATRVGGFDTELVAEFWQAVTQHVGCNLHVLLHYGRNSHHIAEAVFKATARALRMAVEIDPRQPSAIPSTKGVI